MNPYDKLEHEQRAWSVCEAAAFLGYSSKYVYQLIHEGKIEGWMKVEGGGYKFCPVKLKAWMEKRFGASEKPKGLDEAANNDRGEGGRDSLGEKEIRH
jgi:excisionase family DNA binding protein